MRATVDSVISQLASLESVVNNTADSTRTATLSADQNDILQQALKNSGLPNKNEGTSKGNCFIRHSLNEVNIISEYKYKIFYQYNFL